MEKEQVKEQGLFCITTFSTGKEITKQVIKVVFNLNSNKSFVEQRGILLQQ